MDGIPLTAAEKKDRDAHRQVGEHEKDRRPVLRREPHDALDGAGPAPLEAVCRHALAEDPGSRYPNVAALADDVAAYLERRPVSAYRESAPERVARLAAKYKTPILLVVAYLAMRVALFLFGGR